MTEPTRQAPGVGVRAEDMRRFIEFAPVSMAIFDTDMRYLAASARWRADFGLDGATLEGRSHYDLLPVPERWKDVHRRCLAGAVERAEEDIFESGDGPPSWLRWEVRPWHADAGVVGGLIIFTEDITARKRTEAQLRDALSETQLLVDAATQGILSVDQGGLIVTANGAADAMFGYAPGELLGQPVERLLSSSRRSAHASLRDGYFANPRTRAMGSGRDLTGQRKDGSILPIEVSLSYAETVAGRRAVAFVTDITERLRAVETLRSSHQLLNLALDAAAAAAFQWNLATDVVEADDRIHARLDRAPETPIVGADFFNHVHSADRSRIQAVVAAVGRGEADGWNIEYRFLRADGAVRWHRSVAQATRDAAGAVVVTGVSSDVTERKNSEAELERSHRVLAARAAELEDRTAQLARLASELTLAEQHARQELARTLHDHVQQLLFSSALTLSRLAARGSVGADDAQLLTRARAELDEAISAARSLSVELYPPVLRDGGLPAALAWLARWVEQKYGLAVTLTSDEGANPDRDDVRTLLFASVRELLFNVVKHAGVAAATIDLQLTPDDEVRISVADEGVGFEAADILGRGNCVGLGLFTIQERLALLGGRMDVVSTPGRGARFVLTAPRTDGTNVRSPLVPSGAGADAAPPHPVEPRPPVRILIVDDHVLVRQGLTELIAEQPELQVVGEACDGLHAIALARALRPDVILMDVSMPGMDGVEATRRIHEEWPGICIFGLSTQEQLTGLHAILRAGAEGYFTKDDDSAHLIAALRARHAAGLPAAPPAGEAPQRGTPPGP